MRRIAFQIHLWIGAGFAVFLLISGITGSLLMLQPDLREGPNTQLDRVQPSAAAQPLADILHGVEHEFRGYRVRQVRPASGPGRSHRFLLAGSHGVLYAYADPGTGRVLGSLQARSGFARTVHQLHGDFLAGPPGRSFNGALGAGLMLLCISGFVLWLPAKRWTLVKGAGWKRQLWNLHNAVGVFALLFLAFEGFSGVYLAFPSESRALLGLPKHDGPGPARGPRAKLAPLDVFLEEARRAPEGFRLTALMLPPRPQQPVTGLGADDSMRLLFDPATGRLLRVVRTSDQPAAERFLDTLRALHAGRIGGTTARVLWFVLGITPGLLAATGIVMWLNRRTARRRVRKLNSTTETDMVRTLSCLLVLCVAANIHAAERGITGTVVDQTRAAIAGAEVTLACEGAQPAKAITGPLGEFTLDAASSGACRLTAVKSGFEATTVTPSAGFAPTIVLKAESVRTTVTVSESLGYQVSVATSATKTATPLLDIPQSVQPVPRRVIEEQAALSMNDVLRNVSGVSPSLGEGRRDHILIRGFNAASDEYIDGVRDDALYYRDLSNIETVEVLKGPSAVLFGRGSAGGLVNRVTKKPVAERPVGSVKVMAGSYGTGRTEVDASKPWLDGKLAGRLNGAYEDSGSHRDFYNLNRYAFSPSLQWAPAESTSLLGQFEYLNDDRVPDRGIPSLNGAPARVRAGAYYGYPDEDHIRTHVDSFALTFQHRFSDRYTLRNMFRGTGYSTDFSNTFPNGVTAGQVLRGQYNGTTTQDNVFNQTEATAAVSWLGFDHLVLGGIEAGHQSRDNAQFTGTAASVALINPILTRPVYSTVPASLNHFTGTVVGVYVQDQITWRRWRFLAGVRRDRYEQSQDSLLAGVADLGRTDRAWSPRFGVVYRAAPWASAYASYSRTFHPSGEGLSLAVNNQELEPERTRNIEAGVKTELLNGSMTATASVFRLDRTNIKTTDPQNPLLLILVGAQRTDGVELNLAGRITRRFNVTGGYAFFDPRIRRSNSLSSGVPIEGKIPSLVARRSGSLWATYFWDNGLGVGAGAFQSARRFTANDDLVVLPGYVRFDAAVFYRLRHWGWSFNIHNLLNRDYYESAQSNSQIYPGAPANGLLTMTYRW